MKPIHIASYVMVSVSACLVSAGVASADKADSTPNTAAKEAPMPILRKQVTVTADLADVWHAWTTTAGVIKFGPPQAHVELRVGGPYEWYFMPDAPAGSRGSDGCRVLSYLPMEMLSFDWNAPPSIPALRDAGAKTHVVIQFVKQPGGRVTVTLSQLGFGEGPDWDAYYDYFDKAWPRVLSQLNEHFATTGSGK